MFMIMITIYCVGMNEKNDLLENSGRLWEFSHIVGWCIGCENIDLEMCDDFKM